jgi:glycine/D-amino acid oxidase-like deaminating enzyme
LFNNSSLFENCFDKLNYLNEMVEPITRNKQTYKISDSDISKLGFQNFDHMIFNAEEGQIDTGMMMQSLIVLAQKSGIYILNGHKIKSLTPNSSSFLLENQVEIEAKKILVCTNGFGKQLLPELHVNPARAQVLITKPIENLAIKGTFHFDEGYYYFRNIGNRVLFGGGRNLDFKAEETTEMHMSEKIQNQLDRLLRENILPNTSFEIEHRWSGIMGVGREKSPIVKKISDSVFCAVRMGGMGVAIGSLVGEEAAEMLLNSD